MKYQILFKDRESIKERRDIELDNLMCRFKGEDDASYISLMDEIYESISEIYDINNEASGGVVVTLEIEDDKLGMSYGLDEWEYRLYLSIIASQYLIKKYQHPAE